MIDVACFCGCSYSFVGNAGICPKCGERTSFARRPYECHEPESGDLEDLIQRLRDVPPEELAA
jgi:hypothetical protein